MVGMGRASMGWCMDEQKKPRIQTYRRPFSFRLPTAEERFRRRRRGRMVVRQIVEPPKDKEKQ